MSWKQIVMWSSSLCYRHEAGGAVALGGGAPVSSDLFGKYQVAKLCPVHKRERPMSLKRGLGTSSSEQRRQSEKAAGVGFWQLFLSGVKRTVFGKKRSIPTWKSNLKKAEKCSAPGSHTHWDTHVRAHTHTQVSDIHHDHQTGTHTCRLVQRQNFTKSCRWNVSCSLTPICFTVEWWRGNRRILTS